MGRCSLLADFSHVYPYQANVDRASLSEKAFGAGQAVLKKEDLQP